LALLGRKATKVEPPMTDKPQPSPVGENRVKALLKIMGEPVVLRLDDELAKTRTRLLVVSTLSIGIVVADLRIKEGSTLLGLQIANLTDSTVRVALAIVTAYLLVHFFWGALDGLREWRLRLTGTRYTADTIGSWDGYNRDGDLSTEPRHSTLYNWWKEQAEGRSEIDRTFAELVAEVRLKRPGPGQPADYVEQTVQKLNDVERVLKEFKESVLESPRIMESLKRYDAWHRSLVRSENVRWIIFDFAVPVFVGLGALLLLVPPMWQLTKRALQCVT
jgi:DNA-binding transcriptional ArsR family regulator